MVGCFNINDDTLIGKSAQEVRCNCLLSSEPQKGSVSSNLTLSVFGNASRLVTAAAPKADEL